ncbi:MAG: aromatic acid decarboxylase, partial [Rhodospirillaceae bacterium]|nr:aromatic acid decarboxylase [Rhodospirillaceae bacterium]
AFYQRPETVDDIVNQTVDRALDLFGFDLGLVKRWGEPAAAGGVGKPARKPAKS